MKDSKEKETRISNLKNMIGNISKNEDENLDSFNDEDLYEDSEDYEIIDAEDMINTLSEDYDKYSQDEFEIDDEYIYKPSEDTNIRPSLFEDSEIDEDFIINTKFEHTDFPEADSEDYMYENEYDPFSFDDSNSEEYISEKFDSIVNKKVGKYPLLAIFGLILGILFLIFAILTSLSSSQRIIDSVSSGEVNTSAALFILLGLLFIILSIYKLITIKSPFDNAINSIKNIDKEKHEKTSTKYKEVEIEQKTLANDNKKVKKVGEFDITDIKQKIENATSNTDEIKQKIEPNKKENKKPLTKEEEEYEKAKLDSESIDDIFADMKEIEDVPVISIDSKNNE